jgi:tellurite resistance protein TehA-like permease
MATGIVSVGLHLAGFVWAARVLLGIAAALWVVLAVTFCTLLGGGGARWREETSAPSALTTVAGTGVLGDGVAMISHPVAAAVLLGLTTVLWLVLLPRVLGNLRWRVPGAAYMVTVATQAVAVLAATLAVELPARWLLWPAGVMLALGLLLYVLVLTRFDFGEVVGGAGDHWVAGGSLSISALAFAKVTLAADGLAPLAWGTLAVLAAALAWYAVLVLCEVLRPRTGYDGRRWSTVFPLGMTAVAAMTAGRACDVPWLGTLGEVLLWPAVIAWAVVAAGAVRHAASS